MTYYSKKPIRSFQDLQVYQLSYNLAVKIVKTLPGSELSTTLLSIPRLLATAHSLRFGDPEKGIEILEQTMLNCNLAIHYLSLARDLDVRSDLNVLDFDSLTKQYLQLRTKILRLQMSWKKFAKDYAKK